MKIINKTSFEVIAFGWHNKKGYGDDVPILPGQSVEVNGPYLGEMDGGKCYIALDGEIICHEGPDCDVGLHIAKNKLIALKNGDNGVTIRHCEDELEPQVAEWRREKTALQAGVTFFRAEQKRWGEQAEDSDVFGTAGNMTASVICDRIATDLARGEVTHARQYLERLKVHEPNRVAEANQLLALLPAA